MKPMKTVLVVDDDRDFREMLATHLSHKGYRIREAVDGWDALSDLLLNGKVDLIISDYLMPRLTGVELHMLSRESGLYIPFILMSGTINLEKEKLAKKGITSSLAKPFSLKELDEAIRDTFQRHLSLIVAKP